MVEKQTPAPRPPAKAPKPPPKKRPGRGSPRPGANGGLSRPVVRWNGAVAGRSEQHDTKRAAILATAARLFEERGYHETSLADIAAALGVTKPTLYYYVANKEDIVAQIIERALESVQACADLARAQERTGLERLRAFARGYAEGMSTDSGRCLLALRRVPIGRAARARNSAGYRRIDALGRDLIAEGIADGSIRRCDVKLAAFALFGALNAIPDWFHPNEPLSAPEVGDAIFELFARGLGASSPERKE